MSCCLFISSNSTLQEIVSENDVTIRKMSYYEDVYSGMKYANEIDYYELTKGKVEKIFDYIKNAMLIADNIELWRVWIDDCQNQVTKTKSISLKDLSFDYLYDYLVKLEKAPILTRPLHADDEEKAIYYKLEIYK